MFEHRGDTYQFATTIYTIHRLCQENTRLYVRFISTQGNGRNIAEFDRVIVVCSEHSLERPGVLYEIKQTLAREAAEGGSKLLIPLTIDQHLIADAYAKAQPDIARELRKRVKAPFPNNGNDPAFPDALANLLRALGPDPHAPNL